MAQCPQVTIICTNRKQLATSVCGPIINICFPCAGKSTFAQQLASRLNLPNVLQTDILYEVRQSREDAPQSTRPAIPLAGSTLPDQYLPLSFCMPCCCCSCCGRGTWAHCPAPHCGVGRVWQTETWCRSSRRSAASYGRGWKGTCARWAAEPHPSCSGAALHRSCLQIAGKPQNASMRLHD